MKILCRDNLGFLSQSVLQFENIFYNLPQCFIMKFIFIQQQLKIGNLL